MERKELPAQLHNRRQPNTSKGGTRGSALGVMILFMTSMIVAGCTRELTFLVGKPPNQERIGREWAKCNVVETHCHKAYNILQDPKSTLAQALAELEKGKEWYPKDSNPPEAQGYFWNVGMVHEMMGNWPHALEFVKKAHDAAGPRAVKRAMYEQEIEYINRRVTP